MSKTAAEIAANAAEKALKSHRLSYTIVADSDDAPLPLLDALSFDQGYEHGKKEMEMLIDNVAGEVLYSLKDFDPWIKVEDGLPEADRSGLSISVLVYTGEAFAVAYYDPHKAGWYDMPNNNMISGTVTHWMPIPPIKEG
jgi:hypothetical protein